MRCCCCCCCSADCRHSHNNAICQLPLIPSPSYTHSHTHIATQRSSTTSRAKKTATTTLASLSVGYTHKHTHNRTRSATVRCHLQAWRRLPRLLLRLSLFHFCCLTRRRALYFFAALLLFSHPLSLCDFCFCPFFRTVCQFSTKQLKKARVIATRRDVDSDASVYVRHDATSMSAPVLSFSLLPLALPWLCWQRCLRCSLFMVANSLRSLRFFTRCFI